MHLRGTSQHTTPCNGHQQRRVLREYQPAHGCSVGVESNRDPAGVGVDDSNTIAIAEDERVALVLACQRGD